MPYRQLVEDGHVPGLLVHPDWWEPKHPQEFPITIEDPVALYRPAPEISVEADVENPEIPVPLPAAPVTTPIGTLGSNALAGARFVASEEALEYQIGAVLFVELNGGGTFFASRIVTDTMSPTFTIPFTTPFAGAADAGNNIYIEVT